MAATGDQVPFPVTVDPGCSQRDEQEGGVFEPLSGSGNRLVAAIDERLPVESVKRGVQSQCGPTLSRTDDLLVGERRSFQSLSDGPTNRKGIVKHAHRVGYRFEPRLCGEVADVVGETGANEEKSVGRSDFDATGRNIGDRTKIHGREIWS